MRKMVLVFLVLGILFPVASSWAQNQSVTVANATSNKLEIGGVIIKPRSIKELSLPVANNIATITLSYYEGLELKGPITLTRSVNRGRVILRDFESANNVSAAESSARSSNKATFPEKPYIPDVSTPAPSSWWSTVTVTPQNKLKGQSIFVPTDPFRGLALRSGQKSEHTATLKTGEIVFPVFLTTENDSTNNSGVKFSWALVNKIVTEGQSVFEFRPEDIMKANAGETIKKTIVSKLNFDFIISEGESRGEVVPAGYPTKLELYIGWNILPIQYKDAGGLPTQAILILLVNDLRKPLMARGKGSADQISVSRDNIVITNFSR